MISPSYRTKFPTSVRATGTVFGNEAKDRDLVQKLMALNSVATTITSRAELGAALGKTYQGNRDLYTALGYKNRLTFCDLNAKYQRQDICQRIVNAYPDATWVGEPELVDDPDPEVSTPLEEAWMSMVKNLKLFHYMNRFDRLLGVGQYGVLVMGLNDLGNGRTMKDPVQNASELLYLQAYSQGNAEIVTFETDITNERFGLPTMYQITLNDPNSVVSSGLSTGVTTTMFVHWTRVIHGAEGMQESNVFGTPRLQAVYNRTDDLERVVGGSSEMFWRGAFPGVAFEMDNDATLTPQGEQDLEDEVFAYIHGLSRYLKLKGMKANSLSPNISDPKGHVEVIMDLIAGTCAIPKRQLTGSERGELASTQDQSSFNNRTMERRVDFAEPWILRPFIDRMIEFGILPNPKDGEYEIIWPDVQGLSEKDQAEVSVKKTQALAAFVQSGAVDVFDAVTYLTEVVGFTQETAQLLVESMADGAGQEDEELDRLVQEALAAERQRQEEEAAGDALPIPFTKPAALPPPPITDEPDPLEEDQEED